MLHVKKLGQHYLKWPATVLFAVLEHRQIHRHFFMLSPDKNLGSFAVQTRKKQLGQTWKDLVKCKKSAAFGQELPRHCADFEYCCPTESVFPTSVFVWSYEYQIKNCFTYRRSRYEILCGLCCEW